MGSTISRRIVESLPLLDEIAEYVQPKVQVAANAGGKTVRNILDGTPLELPVHPAITDVPMGSWTATFVFDALDVVSGSKPMRNAADATLTLGILGGFAAAATGLSDWRYLSGGARKMGVAHGLLNVAGLTLSTASLALRAGGNRNAGRLAFLVGFSLTGTAAHLGGELSYEYGLRVNRNAFEHGGPDEFTSVMPEDELNGGEMRRVDFDGVGVLVSRSQNGGVCAISASCNHFSGPLDQGSREGDTVVCPWHGSRFNLCTGAALDGPAIFPQSTYETRVRDGNIEIRAVEQNIQKQVR